MDETPATGNEIVKPKRSLRFKIGLLFLIINTPIGYGGGALTVGLGVKTGQPALGASVGAAIYIISWCMLGLGILMAGPEGVQIVKDFRRRLMKKPPGSSTPST